ncbi:MAG: hypothetical protein QOK28_414 [Actinomycetota bacterium]|jgi:hypothetical protein
MRIARWLALVVLAGALFSVASPANATAPANDSSSSPTTIASLPFSATESTVGATDDSGVAPSGCGLENSVWFKYTAPAAGHLVVQTRGSSFDTVLAMHWDSASGPANCVDDGARQRSVLTFDTEAGRTYFIEAGGFLGQTGTLILTANAGGSLTGVVRHAQSGQSFANACVSVLSAVGQRYSAVAGPDGVYRFDGLPSGEYQTATCDFRQGRARPWSTVAYAVEGRSTAGPDILLDTSALTGVVTDRATGAPLRGACVNVDSTTSDPIFSSTSTSVTGYYAVQLPPGSYSVKFSGCANDGYAAEYYDGAFAAASETVVNLSAGITTNGIDAGLARNATIVGTLREAGTNGTIFASCVHILDSATDAPLANASVSTTGYYHVAVPPVPVVIQGGECNTVPGPHIAQWYDGNETRSGATVVALASGGTFTANLRLPVGGKISGAEMSDETGNGVSPSCVRAERTDGLVFRNIGVNESNGNYTIQGLPTGMYRVSFCGNGNDLAPEWFDNANDRASAQLVSIGVTSNATVSARLGRGGAAHGSIVDNATGKRAPLPPCFKVVRDAGDFVGYIRQDLPPAADLSFYGLATGHYLMQSGCGMTNTTLGSFDAVAGDDVPFSTVRIPSADTDQDGVSDALDNCPLTPNANQADANHDDLGDLCDLSTPTSSGSPKLSVFDKSVPEGNLTHAIQLRVKLSAPSSSDVTFVVKTANMSATAGFDYVAVNRTVTIPAGSTVVYVPISIKGDHVVEPDEAFRVRLSSPAGGAVLGRSAATITLTNDD